MQKAPQVSACGVLYLSSAMNSILRPSGLTAFIEPLCPSAMVRAIESPMPKPPELRDLSVPQLLSSNFSVEKFTKI
jgi:hypothetical protein